MYADPESIQILTFPNAVAAPPDEMIRQKLLSFLPHEFESLKDNPITQFKSGKRRYSCRAFVLEDHWSSDEGKARIALMLERAMVVPPVDSRKHRKLAGMYEDPFGFSPDSKYFALSRANQDVFLALRNMVLEGRGIGILLGQAGIGKSLLLESLAENLRGQSEIAFFPGSFESRKELVRAVMALLGVDGLERGLAANLQRLEKWLISKTLSGRRITLICDDAQDLSLETLENLCLFSDLTIGQQKLLQIILAGRQGLLQKLNGSRLRAKSSDINVFCRLSPLDDAEVCNYVSHRLRVAGCTRELFTSAALASVALYSRGIPLNINMICRHSLSVAASTGLQAIDERVASDAAYDLVFKARPVDFWEGPDGNSQKDSRRQSDATRRRHGLKLVRKS